MKVNLPPKPPLVQKFAMQIRRWHAKRDGGVVKNIDFVKKQSLTASRRSSLYTREPFFLLALGKISLMRQLPTIVLRLWISQALFSVFFHIL